MNSPNSLDFYKKFQDNVGSLAIKKIKKMFEEIAKEIKHISKTKLSETHCENRWIVLERNYKFETNWQGETTLNILIS